MGCVLSNITEALKDKETVQISGFGSFKVSKREARKGRNPQTGEEIDIEAKMVLKFVPGGSIERCGKINSNCFEVGIDLIIADEHICSVYDTGNFKR